MDDLLLKVKNSSLKEKFSYSSDFNEFRKLIKHKQNLLDSENLQKGKKAETNLWLLFSKLEPLAISKENIIIDLNNKKYQIDLLLIFNEALFVIEIKEGESHFPSKHISWIHSNKSEIQNNLKKNLNLPHSINIVFFIYYSDFLLKREHFLEARNKKIILLTQKHIDFYENLINELKKDARDIIFSDFLRGKRIFDKNSNVIKIPALRSQNQFGYISYFFLATPYLLKRICYVHRRNMQFSLEENDISYQRIIDPKRIKDIQKFLKNDGFFPNSILINFEKNVEFYYGTKEKKLKFDKKTQYGYLILPNEYGCAWIIDGQHRVFGYSGDELDEKSKEHFLSVIAFEKMLVNQQAKLYVDINENQKKIDRVDIWDLYTQLEEEDSPNYVYSWVIKELNKKNKYLKEKIYIPSISNYPKKQYPININNFGTALKRCRNLIKELIVGEGSNLDKNKLFELLNYYFDLFYEIDGKSFHERSSFYYSNNGIAVLLYLLNHFYDYLKEKKIDWSVKKYTDRLKNHIYDFSLSIIKTINSIHINDLENYLKQSSESGRQQIKNEILEKVSKNNNVFKFILNKYIKLQETQEIEFKETLIFDIKSNKLNEQMFYENVLGTICSFINSEIEGKLYIGITDEGLKKGINYELNNYFGGKKDKVIRFIQDKIKEKMMFKDYQIDQIKIREYLDEPFILVIENYFINNEDENDDLHPVCILKPFSTNDNVKVYLRINNEKRDISKTYKQEIVDRVKEQYIMELISDYHQLKK
jgi:DGQHR domain-containing protein